MKEAVGLVLMKVRAFCQCSAYLHACGAVEELGVGSAPPFLLASIVSTWLALSKATSRLLSLRMQFALRRRQKLLLEANLKLTKMFNVLVGHRGRKSKSDGVKEMGTLQRDA